MARIRPELQVTPIESGLVCAAMLLHARGCRTATAKLREELDLGRHGSTPQQLAALFTARGIAAEVTQRPLEEVVGLRAPFIVSWGPAGYVVVERIGQTTVTVVDPAIGRRTAPRSELEENYSGYCLVPGVESGPMPEEPATDAPRPFRTAMRRAALPLTGVALASIAVYATDIAAPYLTQKIIEAVVADPDVDLVDRFWPWVVGVAVVVALGLFARSWFIAGSATRIGRSTAEEVLDHLLGLPYRYFDARQPGELAYRLGGIAAIRDSLSDQLFTGFFQIGGLAVYLGFVFTRSWVLGLVTAVFVVAMLSILFGSRGLFYSAIQNEQSQTGRMQAEQLEAIQSILTLKTRPRNDQFLARWRRQNEVSLSYLRRRLLLQGGVGAATGVLQFTGPLVTLFVGLTLWQRGDISLGVVFAVFTVTGLLFATANAIYGSVALFLICRTFARRIEDITMTERQRAGDLEPEELGTIEAHDVGFRYTKDGPQVLEGVDVQVAPGSTVAIVGPTGSGKSTLAKLLLGLYDPTEGDVTYGGVPVGRITPRSLFTRLAFVPQEITLETATIHENVSLGRDVTREQVVEACRIACVHDDIEGFPSGYDTMVNNLGANLSGGQRQRIALARAVLDRPEVLVLDEATSSLDGSTEEAITTHLKELGCTIVVIAHRLASVVDADVTYVLRRGRIVEAGSHTSLLEQRGAYHALFASQAAA
jgi:ABC-type bacteriocin/lantibiotic exporter with double-glycine peptidase domain